MRSLLYFLLSVFSSLLYSQDHRTIKFPDLDDYVTIVADLHIHTVFSDGSVWPDIRVQEALFDGVDAISITDHIEYQPHKEDIPHPDRNRSYDLAKRYAEGKDLMVIRGVEITRSMPPGHCNAIFIQDANKLIIDDPLAVFREAKRQGAFTFWNHPNWTSHRKDGIARLTDLHRQLIDEGLLHGVEVVNEHTISDEALAIVQENNLVVLGTSDIHGLIDWSYDVHEGGHRPVTLVFGNEMSEDGLKDGLMNGRTVVWSNNNLIGNPEYLVPLINNCIQVKEAGYDGDTQVLNVTITNNSDARFLLRNLTDYTFHDQIDVMEIQPNAETDFAVKTLKKLDRLALRFEVLNAIEAPNKHPELELQVVID